MTAVAVKDLALISLDLSWISHFGARCRRRWKSTKRSLVKRAGGERLAWVYGRVLSSRPHAHYLFHVARRTAFKSCLINSRRTWRTSEMKCARIMYFDVYYPCKSRAVIDMLLVFVLLFEQILRLLSKICLQLVWTYNIQIVVFTRLYVVELKLLISVGLVDERRARIHI